jgi:hypothetical protein
MGNAAQRFGIGTAEYEQERDVFDMCRWINHTLAEMEKEADFDTIYFERRGANVKQLIEEAMPVANLGLHLYRPPDTVSVQCFVGNQPYDAIVTVSGFRNFRIHVEVTTIENKESILRRQCLSRNGTWSTGRMTKEGREIQTEVEMVDVLEEYDKWIALALDRASKKLNKQPPYGPDTAIVVSLDPFWPLPIRFRAELVDKTESLLCDGQYDIYGVYYCYSVNF